MLDMLKRHEIQVLRRAGHAQADVAQLAGVSERSVRRVAAEPAVSDADTATERSRRRIGRPNKVDVFRDFVTEVLKAEPELMSLEILRRARLQGYRGGKSGLYGLIASLRPAPTQLVTRFDGLPGEFSQHDFGQVDVRYIDGRRERIHFFASRLKYSRWVEVTVVPNEQVESLVRALVDHLAGFGGIPLLAVFDRPKTIAIKWGKNGTVTDWNPAFSSVVLDLGLGVELCWPHRPNQKGSIENLVGWVKGSFFKQRRFVDHADLLEQLAAWQREVNSIVPSRATGVIPEIRRAEELPRLRPLKVGPAELVLRFPVLVGPTGYVLFDTRHYSMHPEAIGLSGTLFLYRDRVRIVAGRFEAWHARIAQLRGKSTLPEHRAALVAAASGARGQRYFKRQQLLEVGEPALEYLTEITHRRPRAWVQEIEELFELLQLNGPEPLRAAFAASMATRTIGVEYVRRHLKTRGGRGGVPPQSPPQRPPAPATSQPELPL
jgi:transposase